MLLDKGLCVEPDCSKFLVQQSVEDGQSVTKKVEQPTAEQPTAKPATAEPIRNDSSGVGGKKATMATMET